MTSFREFGCDARDEAVFAFILPAALATLQGAARKIAHAMGGEGALFASAVIAGQGGGAQGKRDFSWRGGVERGDGHYANGVMEQEFRRPWLLWETLDRRRAICEVGDKSETCGGGRTCLDDANATHFEQSTKRRRR